MVSVGFEKDVVLIVDDDPVAAEPLRRVAVAHGQPLVVSTDGAHAAIEGRRYLHSLIISGSSSDDAGLATVSQARVAGYRAPALLLCSPRTSVDLNRAFDLGATVIQKPVRADRLEEFLRRAASLEARLGETSTEWAVRYGISASEREILLRFANGETREQISRERHCSELTLKKHVSNLLSKVAGESLAQVVVRLLREAAGRGRMDASPSESGAENAPKGVWRSALG